MSLLNYFERSFAAVSEGHLGENGFWATLFYSLF
jgi:hypothetical protein